MNKLVEQNADSWCQEQMRRKMALKDELKEKVISMLENERKESLLLRKENEELQTANSKLVEEKLNQKVIVKEHMDCNAKVTACINYVL